MSLLKLLFGFHGRINRLQYWAGNILTTLLTFAALAIAYLATGRPLAAPQSEAEIREIIESLDGVLTAVSFLMTWAALALQTKRFHDRDKSGFMTLVMFLPAVPIGVLLYLAQQPDAQMFAIFVMMRPFIGFSTLISLAFVIELGSMPGTEGSNGYGESPNDVSAGEKRAARKASSDGNPAVDAAIASAVREQSRMPVRRAVPASVAPAPGPSAAASPRPMRGLSASGPSGTGASAGFGRRRAV